VCNASGTCTHPDNTDSCDDGLFCTTEDVCTGGSCGGVTGHCADDVPCTIDSCNETTNSCDNQPSNLSCNDNNSCTIDTCDAELGCRNVFSCVDICRPASFYGTHSGTQSENDNITQKILDAVGGIEVCGQFVTETSNAEEPFLGGLGLDSALEGLCVRTQHVGQRSLYRELLTAALNCAISGSDDCNDVVSDFIERGFDECSELCSEGDTDSEFARDCTHQLWCYNRGGRIIDGNCAIGNCDITNEYCGSDFGPCPPVAVGQTFPVLQVCERFSNNCRRQEFCQPGLDVCPDRLPRSSSRACREARNNECTIDFCSINED